MEWTCEDKTIPAIQCGDGCFVVVGFGQSGGERH